MKDLFHGTTYNINDIDLTQGKGYKDFGKGFYATAIKNHADNIARRNKYRLEAKDILLKQRGIKYHPTVYRAYRYNLEFDDDCIQNPDGIKVKVFSGADLEWMRFVLKNRESEMSVHDYDIVIGPTADENTVTIINAYKEDLIATDYADDILKKLILLPGTANEQGRWMLGRGRVEKAAENFNL